MDAACLARSDSTRIAAESQRTAAPSPFGIQQDAAQHRLCGFAGGRQAAGAPRQRDQVEHRLVLCPETRSGQLAGQRHGVVQ